MTDSLVPPKRVKPMSATQILIKHEQLVQASQAASMMQAQIRARSSQMTSQQLAQAQQFGLQALGVPSVTPTPNAFSTTTNFTLTTTRDSTLYQREYEVSRIVKRSKGYFYVITVDATDAVYYRVWRGGLFPYIAAKVFKRFGRDINGNKGSWNTVTKRTHLPATLGSAYEKVDAVIKEDIESIEHDKYVTELLKTEPDSLKMIGGLERLQEGDVDAVVEPEHDPNAGTSHNVGGSYSNNLAVSGSALAISGQPGQFISLDADPSIGNIIAGELNADKIVLNGIDLAQTITDRIQEATEALDEKLTALETDMKEVVNAP